MSAGTELAAWGAGALATASILKQVYDIIRGRRKEKTAVEEALDKQPLIRQQLELGNVGTAISHINQVVVSQATYIDRLEGREKALEAEVDGYRRLVDECRTENAKLGNRVNHLEDFLRTLGYNPDTLQKFPKGET